MHGFDVVMGGAMFQAEGTMSETAQQMVNCLGAEMVLKQTKKLPHQLLMPSEKDARVHLFITELRIWNSKIMTPQNVCVSVSKLMMEESVICGEYIDHPGGTFLWENKWVRGAGTQEEAQKSCMWRTWCPVLLLRVQEARCKSQYAAHYGDAR